MDLTKAQADKLVKGCIKNDRTAQEALYKLFHADMLRVCLNYLPEKELAREAFNSGFLKVFRSIKNFDPEKGELGGWIRKMMIHTAIDLCRSELKFNNTLYLDEDDEKPFIAPDVLEKLYFADILQSIRRLPLATQTVFNLAVIDGFSHKEIGEQLNITEGTSRWHLSVAKRHLKEMLSPTGKGNQNADERRGLAK